MMTHGSFWQRLVRGHGWTWLAEHHRAALPADLASSVMTLDTRDRLHAKQGRTTARVVFDAPTGTLPVYLKRHYALPLLSRLGALVHPRGRYSPAAAEWAHLERVRSLGVAVPEVVAAGERIGPWGNLTSFLMVAELTGALPLHEALPALAATSQPGEFAAWKRALVREMAGIVATLHGAGIYHKDLYLCHFFLEMNDPLSRRPRLSLIDLHRTGEHRVWANRWRWKDLGQLLFSTRGVGGADDRDCLRFWSIYRKALGLRWPRWHMRMIRLKAERYLAHNT